MNVHFIAIGGSAMHNLAIALKKKGSHVTGSDDEIFEPAKSRLRKYDLLPEEEGWFPERITKDLDAIILGMHARADNPELLKAQELGIKVYSYPEFLYEQAKNKRRVVIGGSHGKTTITAMILHVLQTVGKECDYMVGAQLEGFEVMVKLTSTAPIMVFEGDEYLTSPIDRRPKFHLYMPDIALISGIAWDHMNVFPTFDNYIEQFRIFARLVSKNGKLIYCTEDKIVAEAVKSADDSVELIGYGLPENKLENGITCLITPFGDISLKVFGHHNLLNLNGALEVCRQLGVADQDFYKAISSFKGASNRLESIGKNSHTMIFRDFAHSPSKLKATTSAVKEQFPNRKLVACMELHTYSSLSQAFLEQYAGAMDAAELPLVFFNPHALAIKKLPPITPEQVKIAFGRKDILVFTDSDQLFDLLQSMDWKNKNLLMMSSGDFGGKDVKEFANQLLASV
jgi:UDP-N-acetylmuramate: L-alanyl-gamma-D-glutamyl-meso-diaminopimelate ligase